MACTNPILAYVKSTDPITGKKSLSFVARIDANYRTISSRYGKENTFFLPCGKCPSCRKDRAKIWAVRCCLEASQYERNSFITLTYEQNHLPKGGLCKHDVDKFIKFLRKETGQKIRYFYCGEYGETTFRPHYHLILFNYFPEDATFHYTSENGYPVFKSKFLNKIWCYKGFVEVGSLTFQSALYCSKYILKQDPDNSKCTKIFVPANKAPVFHRMSLKPGIGADYIKSHLEQLFESDAVYINGESNNLGNYFNKIALCLDPDKFKFLQDQRIDAANSSIVNDMLKLGLPNREEYYLYRNKLAQFYFNNRALKKGV